MEGKCQVEGCYEPAKYAIGRRNKNNEKQWLHVCDKHEIEIARENGERLRKG